MQADMQRQQAHPEQEARLVLAEEGAHVLSVLPARGDVAGQAAALSILQHQRQVAGRHDDLQGIDDVDVAVAQLCLYLQHAQLCHADVAAPTAYCWVQQADMP